MRNLGLQPWEVWNQSDRLSFGWVFQKTRASRGVIIYVPALALIA
jgi:hypothetical protein